MNTRARRYDHSNVFAGDSEVDLQNKVSGLLELVTSPKRPDAVVSLQ